MGRADVVSDLFSVVQVRSSFKSGAEGLDRLVQDLLGDASDQRRVHTSGEQKGERPFGQQSSADAVNQGSPDSKQMFFLSSFNGLNIVNPSEVVFLQRNVSCFIYTVDENVARRELCDLILESGSSFDLRDEHEHLGVLLVRMVVKRSDTDLISSHYYLP